MSSRVQRERASPTQTFHPLKLGLSQGTVTIQKIKPNTDPTDLRDQFDVLAQIE